MEINSNSYNNFNERYKDVDLSNIENDSQSYDRKLLETIDEFDRRITTEIEMSLHEMDLANNNDDEILRRTKILQITNDFNSHIERINNEYDKALEELKEKYERKSQYPFYHKWMFIGDSKDYPKLLNGLEYYIKLMNGFTIQVYYDVKFSTYLGEYTIVTSDWKEII